MLTFLFFVRHKVQQGEVDMLSRSALHQVGTVFNAGKDG